MDRILLRTIDGLEYIYHPCHWGDIYEGGKIVLQRMGIAPGLAFPGEPGANKRQITTIHTCGYTCTIKLNRLDDRFPYCVWVSHPGRSWQRYEPLPEQVFPGVTLERRYWGDRYVGKRADLIAASLVQDGFFPGDPGMRKTRQVIYADGSFPLGAPTSNLDWSRRREAGAKEIEKLSNQSFSVTVQIDRAERDSRSNIDDLARCAYEREMDAMPRAPRIDLGLQNELSLAASHRRSQLRLVYSRPRFVPGFNMLPEGPFAR